MRVLLQRVLEAGVTVEGEEVGRIGHGLLLLVGLEPADTGDDLEWMAGKIARLRVFSDEEGKLNRSVTEVGGEILAVSQFTLFASYRKGNRPSFSAAAAPEQARALFCFFVDRLEGLLGRPVATGRFGADMRVASVNDGPVTLWLDSRRPE